MEKGIVTEREKKRRKQEKEKQRQRKKTGRKTVRDEEIQPARENGGKTKGRQKTEE